MQRMARNAVGGIVSIDLEPDSTTVNFVDAIVSEDVALGSPFEDPGRARVRSVLEPFERAGSVEDQRAMRPVDVLPAL